MEDTTISPPPFSELPGEDKGGSHGFLLPPNNIKRVSALQLVYVDGRVAVFRHFAESD